MASLPNTEIEIMTISYEHNFHGVTTIRIGKCKGVPSNALSPDFYTRTIELVDREGNSLKLYLYGDDKEFVEFPQEIAIEMGEG